MTVAMTNQPRCISCKKFVLRGVMRCLKCDLRSLNVHATPVPTRGVTRYNGKPHAPGKTMGHLPACDSPAYLTAGRIVRALAVFAAIMACTWGAL